MKNKLEEEQKLLETLEKKRDEIKHHRNEKLTQLKNELDQGTTSDKIEKAQLYLQVVDEKLIEREKKVEEAKKAVIMRQVDLEKIDTHRGEWEKDLEKEEVRQEGIENDDLGSGIFIRRNISSKKKKE